MKKCQIPTGDEYYFVCEKVHERTGHYHLVSRGVCERLCNDAIIEEMSRGVETWHKAHPTPDTYPSLRKMTGGFLAATAKQFGAGNPPRPEAEQKRIIAICRACRYYDGGAKFGPRCRSCGCFIARKIAWGTTSCPLKKWLPFVPRKNG